MVKDYCTCFPDVFHGKNISEACKKHDNDCGQAGDFNFIRHQIDFYKNLRLQLNVGWSLMITVGGAFFCFIKTPYLIYKKIKFKELK